jgi:hypothetical protein
LPSSRALLPRREQGRFPTYAVTVTTESRT